MQTMDVERADVGCGSDSDGDEKASEQVPRNFWLGVRFVHHEDMPQQAPGLVKVWASLVQMGQGILDHSQFPPNAVDRKERESFERDWIANCELKSNRELVSLDRLEGGIGGNNNVTDRQMRFAWPGGRSGSAISPSFDDPNQLVIYLLHPIGVGHRTWTWAEVRDAADAFQKTLVSRLYESATSGTCECVDHQIFFAREPW